LSNVIDVHVARLRRKIDDGFPTRLLHTVRGKGYVLRGELATGAPPQTDTQHAEAAPAIASTGAPAAAEPTNVQ
jgi:DNA-binding winged helix-turn-helix (wHTH) protein